MKIIKKYTAIMIGTDIVNATVKINLEYGEITGAHYNRTHPETEFDTEDEAITYAFKRSKYGRWLIVPVITFED